MTVLDGSLSSLGFQVARYTALVNCFTARPSGVLAFNCCVAGFRGPQKRSADFGGVFDVAANKPVSFSVLLCPILLSCRPSGKAVNLFCKQPLSLRALADVRTLLGYAGVPRTIRFIAIPI
jgi:hypothetical protein